MRPQLKTFRILKEFLLLLPVLAFQHPASLKRTLTSAWKYSERDLPVHGPPHATASTTPEHSEEARHTH